MSDSSGQSRPPSLPDADKGARHDPFEALRHRNFRCYLGGSVLATTGRLMQMAAVQWEIYERTGLPIALGLVGLIEIVPVILLFLPAGHLADVWDRRRIVMGAQIAVMVSSLCLAWISLKQAPVWMIYVCVLFSGIAVAVSGPARSALIPQLLPIESLTNAVTWSSSSFQTASMVGPLMAGVIIAASRSAYLVYLVDAVSAVWMFSMLAMIRAARPVARNNEPVTLNALVAGLSFVHRTKVILASITLDMFAVLLGGAAALTPIFAKILDVGPIGFGMLRAAPSIGALVMAAVIAVSPPFKKAGRTLLLAVAGFGVTMIVFGLSKNFWLSISMLAIGGALDNISVVIRHTLVQVRTPDELRGRVSAVNNVFIGASNELGAFESGLVAQWFGPVASVVSGGVGTIIVVFGVAMLWPELRRFGELRPCDP